MDDIKLPDLSRLDDVEKRLKSLPSQESVNDTSNWENRNVSAPVINVKTGTKTIRQFDLIQSDKLDALTIDQIRKMKAD